MKVFSFQSGTALGGQEWGQSIHVAVGGDENVSGWRIRGSFLEAEWGWEKYRTKGP
jgi:hypothetical protein